MLNRLRPRHVLIASLAIMWANYALTSRWAAIPGSIHGPKQLLFLALLAIASATVLWRRETTDEHTRFVPTAVLTCGVLFMVAAFFVWFPPSTWTQRPLLDLLAFATLLVAVLGAVRLTPPSEAA